MMTTTTASSTNTNSTLENLPVPVDSKLGNKIKPKLAKSRKVVRINRINKLLQRRLIQAKNRMKRRRLRRLKKLKQQTKQFDKLKSRFKLVKASLKPLNLKLIHKNLQSQYCRGISKSDVRIEKEILETLLLPPPYSKVKTNYNAGSTDEHEDSDLSSVLNSPATVSQIRDRIDLLSLSRDQLDRLKLKHEFNVFNIKASYHPSCIKENLIKQYWRRQNILGPGMARKIKAKYINILKQTSMKIRNECSRARVQRERIKNKEMKTNGKKRIKKINMVYSKHNGKKSDVDSATGLSTVVPRSSKGIKCEEKQNQTGTKTEKTKPWNINDFCAKPDKPDDAAKHQQLPDIMIIPNEVVENTDVPSDPISRPPRILEDETLLRAMMPPPKYPAPRALKLYSSRSLDFAKIAGPNMRKRGHSYTEEPIPSTSFKAIISNSPPSKKRRRHSRHIISSKIADSIERNKCDRKPNVERSNASGPGSSWSRVASSSKKHKIIHPLASNASAMPTKAQLKEVGASVNKSSLSAKPAKRALNKIKAPSKKKIKTKKSGTPRKSQKRITENQLRCIVSVHAVKCSLGLKNQYGNSRIPNTTSSDTANTHKAKSSEPIQNLSERTKSLEDELKLPTLSMLSSLYEVEESVTRKAFKSAHWKSLIHSRSCEKCHVKHGDKQALRKKKGAVSNRSSNREKAFNPQRVNIMKLVSHARTPRKVSIGRVPIVEHTVQLIKFKRDLEAHIAAYKEWKVLHPVKPFPRIRRLNRGSKKLTTESVPLSDQDAKNVITRQTCLLLAHSGFDGVRQTSLELVADVVKDFYVRFVGRLKAVGEREAVGFNHGFPDPIERVLTEMGFGGIRGLHTYYQTRVMDYHSWMKRQCIKRRAEFRRIVKSELGFDEDKQESCELVNSDEFAASSPPDSSPPIVFILSPSASPLQPSSSPGNRTLLEILSTMDATPPKSSLMDSERTRDALDLDKSNLLRLNFFEEMPSVDENISVLSGRSMNLTT